MKMGLSLHQVRSAYAAHIRLEKVPTDVSMVRQRVDNVPFPIHKATNFICKPGVALSLHHQTTYEKFTP